MEYIEKGTPTFRRTLVSMFLGGFVMMTILYWPQPLISLFSKQYQISPSTASFTISLPSAALAISMLLVPSLSSAWGRRKVMCIAISLSSLITLISSFSPSFEFLLVMRFLVGFSLAGFLATALTYLNEEFSPKNIGSVIGIYIAGTAAGGVFGKSVAGPLTDLFSWNIAIFIIGLVSLICSIIFYIFTPESKNFYRVNLSFSTWAYNIKRCFNNKCLIFLYSNGFFLMGLNIAFLNYLSFPLTNAPHYLSQTAIGFVYATTLVGTVSATYFGQLADKYSRAYVICMAVAFMFTGALLSLVQILPLKILAIAIFAFGYFAGHAVASGWVGVVAPKEIKAQASSLYLLFFYIGSSIIGWLGGFFLTLFGWAGVIGLVCVLLGVLTLQLLQIQALLNPAQKKASYLQN